MKLTALLVFGGLSVVALGTAAAEPVRVRVTARISEINDPGQALGGRLVIGQRVTGTYVYNTNTPNQSPNPEVGQYRPFAGEARVRFVTGGLVFESVQPTQGIQIFVNPQNGFGDGQLMMFSTENVPFANGTQVNAIDVEFRGQGNITQSAALANAAPVLTNYFVREVRMSGSLAGSSFTVRAAIEVAELIVASAIDVSPAAGDFVLGQHFDAALLLPRGSVVTFARASVGGNNIGLQYPGSCQLLPPNSAGRPAILCPDADAVLPVAAGAPIDWSVDLANGTVLTETVEWRLVQ